MSLAEAAISAAPFRAVVSFCLYLGFSDRKSVFEQKARTGILLVKGTASAPSGERFSRISAYAIENHNQEGAPSEARE